MLRWSPLCSKECMALEGESSSSHEENKKHKAEEERKKIAALFNSTNWAGRKEFMENAESTRVPQQLACSFSDLPAEDGRLRAGRRRAGTPSGPLPPTAVREQRMGMSENALLPSLVRPQASGPGSGGERLSPWATFQSQTAFPLPPPCRTSSALEDQGPVSTVGSQKPHHSPRRTPSWLMETCQT